MIKNTLGSLLRTIFSANGKPILVGGAVRDMVMAGRLEPDFEVTQDVDIEVFGITLPRLKDALEEDGFSYDEVGEHFSVLKVRVAGLDAPVDLSIPRYEKSTGDGHKEFEVMVDPKLTFAEASLRRDFTCNAMGYNLLTGKLLDPHSGRKAIIRGILCQVSNKFAEDPLRVLRAARFCARFGLTPAPNLSRVAEKMRPLADSLPSERIWMEIEKSIHECESLGDFFRWLRYFGWLDIFPEINNLVGVEQDPEWHPEGDVFTHTVHALNYWSKNLRTGNKEDDLVTAIAILCHDLGKVATTAWNDAKGHITAYGHEESGVYPTITFLRRLRQHGLADKVTPLVANHLAPVYGAPTSKRLRKLSTKVDRIDILCNLSRADQAGRPPKDYSDGFYKIALFEATWNAMDVPRGGPKPLVGGDFLIGLGMVPGPGFKKILDAAYAYQIETGCLQSELESFVKSEFFPFSV